MRVAMAYGTALKRGAVVTASRDTSRVARALKRALIAGLNFAGITVEDVELATVPLTRFQVRNSHAQGGITVRLVPGDPDSVELRFFDADGRDLDVGTGNARSSGCCHREDYRRAFAGDIGDIVFPATRHRVLHGGLDRSVDVGTAPRPPGEGGARLLVRRGVGRAPDRARPSSAPRSSP